MDASHARAASADRFFGWSLAITLVMRVVLAAVVPLTGDEAYFVVWAEHLDTGYYDHGPMVGWWLSAVLLLGKSVWLIRVPALLTTVMVALLIRYAARSFDREKAGWAGALYLWSPHNLLNFFTTTDTPLLLFSSMAGIYAFRAWREDRAVDYLLAGALLGMAFLSKYFAVLLGVSVAALLLVVARPARWGGILLVLLGAVPFAAINIAWNYHHGWTNILFNLYNRTRDAGFGWENVLGFVATTALLTGPLAWFVFRSGLTDRTALARAWQRGRQSGALVYGTLFLIPNLVLLGVSLLKPVGVHWPLSFYPFLFIALTPLYADAVLRRMTRAMTAFGGALTAAALLVVLLPVETARHHRSFDSLVLSTHVDEVLAALEPFRPQYLLATPSYAKSSMLSFFGDEYVPVVGPGSFHARQDDLITDMQSLNGRDILILAASKRHLQMCRGWFAESEVRSISVRGADYRIVLGRNFLYPKYRDQILRFVAARYYRMPGWLDRWSRPSFFFERYGIPRNDRAPPLAAGLAVEPR